MRYVIAILASTVVIILIEVVVFVTEQWIKQRIQQSTRAAIERGDLPVDFDSKNGGANVELYGYEIFIINLKDLWRNFRIILVLLMVCGAMMLAWYMQRLI